MTSVTLFPQLAGSVQMVRGSAQHLARRGRASWPLLLSCAVWWAQVEDQTQNCLSEWQKHSEEPCSKHVVGQRGHIGARGQRECSQLRRCSGHAGLSSSP